MRSVKIILMTALLAGVSMAQEKSESVDGVLKELGNYEGVQTPSAAVVAESEAVVATPEVVAETPAAVVTPTETVVEASVVEESAPEMTDKEVDALVEESRDYYVGGEFARAQAGFKKVIKVKPENIVARMYLRKLLERDARHAEVSGMKEVTKAWNTGLVLRSYDISPEAAEKMGLDGVEGSADVEVKFPEADFPKGASAIYQPKMEKLFVRNTRENLTVIEEILGAMDVSKLSADVDQVEIEAKFVEVSEGTLEELGFNWTIVNDLKLGSGSEFNSDGDGLFQNSLRGSASGVGMPFATPGASTKVASDSSDWTASRFEDTFTTIPNQVKLTDSDGFFGLDSQVDLLISALDQSSGADVLSAPRIVTKSGETATIRVGQLHTYPEVYEPSASGGNIVHVKYDDWEERLLGVELEVTPQVDGDQIEMALNPKFRELQGWQTYDVAPANSAYTWYQYRVGMQFNHADITARLPIFRVREIETEVSIADGATIVMGGLINEKVEAFEDKVPVLGSIPLVGRLFRNEGERAIKRNLMMFVTAKKVEPTGRISTARSFE